MLSNLALLMKASIFRVWLGEGAEAQGEVCGADEVDTVVLVTNSEILCPRRTRSDLCLQVCNLIRERVVSITMTMWVLLAEVAEAVFPLEDTEEVDSVIGAEACQWEWLLGQGPV